MADNLQVGDVAEVIHTAPLFSQYLGTEVQIIALNPWPDKPAAAYLIRCVDGYELGAETWTLRKKRPPDFQVGSWDADIFTKLNWHPNQVNA